MIRWALTPSAGSGDSRTQRTSRSADWLAVVFVCCVGVVACLYVFRVADDPRQTMLGTGFIVTQTALQVAYFSRPGVRYRRWLSYLLLAVYAVLVYLPHAVFGQWWLGIPGLFAGSILLVLPAVVAVPVSVSVVASVSIVDAALGAGIPELTFAVMATVIEGLAVYGLTRLARVVDALDATREEVARSSVAAERVRFADEVYSELGSRLAAIGARTEHALDALNSAPARARTGVADILAVSREALADMRSVARRYREPSTDSETRLDSAEVYRSNEAATQSPDGIDRAGDQAAGTGLSGSRMSAWLANLIVSSVLVGFGIVALASIVLTEPGLPSIALAAAALVGLLTLQLGYFSRPSISFNSRWVAAAVAVQACLAYLPILWFKELWLDFPGFLAGSLLLVLRPLAATLSFMMVVASVGWLRWVYDNGVPASLLIDTALSAGITGLVVFGLTRLAQAVAGLHAMRVDLATAAVARERLRFARDLHDLLGLSLSAITLKADLANRLLDVDRDQAAETLREVVELSHVALGGVRSVATGYRDLTLDDELVSARSVLASAEVDAVVQYGRCAFNDSVGKVLATVLREGVTNVVRHSRAGRCEIIVRRIDDHVQLEIVNDGVDSDRLRQPRDGTLAGTGTRNLTHRVSTLGGELIATAEPGGTYRLRATVPAEP